MDESPQATERQARPSHVRTSRSRWLRRLALTALLLALVPVLVVAMLFYSESGFKTLAGLAVRMSGEALQIDAPTGRLADRLSIGRLRLSLPSTRVDVEQLSLDWRPSALLQRRLDIGRLSAHAVTLSSAPSDEPAALPASLELPLSISVGALAVERLQVLEWSADASAPATETLLIENIRGALESDGRQHRIKAFEANTPFGAARLAALIDAAAPFALEASGGLDGVREGREFSLALDARGSLELPLLKLTATGAGLSGSAELEAAPFAPVPLKRARIELGEIDPSAFSAQAPSGAFVVEADLQAGEGEGEAPLPPEQWVVEGPLRIENRLPGAYDKGRVPLLSLAARVRWAQGRLSAEALDIRLPDKGRIEGRLAWQPDSEDPLGSLTAALSLAGVNAAALDGRLPATRAGGKLDAEGDSAGQTLKARLRDAGFSLELKAAHAGSKLSIEEASLVRGQARLQASGTLDLEGARPFGAQARLTRFDPRAFFKDAPQANLNLKLDASGELSEAVLAKLRYAFAPSTLEGRALEGEGQLTLSGKRLSGGKLWLALAGNRLDAEGAWGGPGDTFALNLDAANLAALAEGFGGKARLEAKISGSLAEPAGEALLTTSELRLPGGIEVTGVNAQGSLRDGLDGAIAFAGGVGEIRRRNADRTVTPLLERATVTVDGRRGAHVVTLDTALAQANTLTARLEGGLDKDMRWAGRLAQLQTAGQVALTLQEAASLEISSAEVVLGAAELRSGEGRITLERTRWSPAQIVARGRMSGLQVGLVRDASGKARSSAGELRLGGEWDLALGERINGLARLFRESGDLVLVGDSVARLGLKRFEAVLSANDGRLALSVDAEGEQLGKLVGSATALSERHEGSWRLVPGAALLGSAELAMPAIDWLGPLASANMATGGSLNARFSLSGTPENPVATGSMSGRELALSLADQGLRLSGGELDASFDKERLRLTRLEFVSPNRVTPKDTRLPLQRVVATPGRLKASGEIALADGKGRFRFEADRLPLLQRADRWLAVSGSGDIISGWDSVDLTARFKADAGSIVIGDAPPPSLSDDVVILGNTAPAGGAFKVAAKVTINLGGAFYVNALGLDTRLAGELQIVARNGLAPSATGQISTVGGVFEGYGQKLEIERGLVSFQGPLERPALNIVALRKGLEVEAGVAITGTARRPQVRLVSEPSVPDPAKLSWIVLGRAPDESNGADLALLIPAAQALLGGTGGGISSQLAGSLGLDQISVGQGDLNSVSRGATSSVVDSGTRVSADGSVSGQVVTLGKRLSAEAFISFEQSLVGAASIVKLSYQLSRRVSVVARGGTDNAVDMYYTFVFR